MLLGAVLAVCGIALGAAAAVGWVVATADNGPNLTELKGRNPHPLTQIFAADGSSLGYVHSDTVYNPCPHRRSRKLLREATIAIEDRRFYQHGALDYQGILRAGVKDLFSGHDSLQGASTLTMQLVDNKYLPARIAANHNLKYKIIQAKLAEQLENKHPKSWILDNYLYDVPYGTVGGQTAIGVGAAAQVFFGKPVWKLSLPQLALLAGLPQAPSQYNPFLHPKLARQRRDRRAAARWSRRTTSPRRRPTRRSASRSACTQRPATRARRQPYVFDYVLHRAEPALRRQHGGERRAEGLHDDRPQAPGAGRDRRSWPTRAAPASRRRRSSRSTRPTATSSRWRPPRYGYGRRRHFDYAWQGHRQTGLGVQGVLADDADPRLRRRPEQDLLHLQAAPPGLAARLSDVLRAHRRAQLPGHDQHHQGDD